MIKIFGRKDKYTKEKKQNDKQKNSIFLNIIIFLTMFLGIVILMYPIVSRVYYDIKTTQVVEDFYAGRKNINQDEINKKISLAKAYNESLNGGVEFIDPYVKNIEEGVKNYARMLEVREKIGVLDIPSIDLNEPIYAGTSEDVLQRGIGHMEMTSLPIGGRSTHTVLTGHRGLPTAKLFSDLNKVSVGDTFYIDNIRGRIAYRVIEKKIIQPNNFSDLVVKKGEDKATLLTCHPYMINSHRLLVIGKRVPYSDKKYEEDSDSGFYKKIKKFILVAVLLCVFLFIIICIRRKRAIKRK